MTQLSAVAMSEIGEACGMSGLDGTRDMAELMEVLVLVRSRVRSSSSTDDVLGQHCDPTLRGTPDRLAGKRA